MSLDKYFSDLTLDDPQLIEKLKQVVRLVMTDRDEQKELFKYKDRTFSYTYYKEPENHIIVITGLGSNGKTTFCKALNHAKYRYPDLTRLLPDWRNWRHHDITQLIDDIKVKNLSKVVLIETEEESQGTISRDLLNALRGIPCPCIVVGLKFHEKQDRESERELIHLEFPTTFVESPSQPNQRLRDPNILDHFTKNIFRRELLNWAK